ncbi:hypothetical protein ACLOJK_012321 [Asimina triloba]
MRRMRSTPPLLLLLLHAASAILLAASIHTVDSATCPYNISASTTIIPPACYANYTTAAADVAPPTNCCWFVFAAYIFAAILHANATGDAFLPADTASACSSAYASYLRIHGLVRPNFSLSADRCNINGDDPTQLAAGKRACQYSTIADIRSAVNLSPGVHACSAGVPDLLSNDRSCTACKDSVVAITLTLLQITKSKEFVPCGMATTIGIWSSSPQIRRFRSYALCLVQVLDDVGSLNTGDLVPSPPPPPSSPANPKSDDGKRRTVKIALASAAAGILFIAAAAALLVLVFAIRKRKRSKSISFSIGDRSIGDPTVVIEYSLPKDGLYIFTKSELKQATNGYDPSLLLGEGGAGKVYLGKLPSGQHVAIKRIQRKKKLGEFYREVEILAKLRHRNLTTLLGYCLQDNEHVLVCEYMPGGNLSRALYHGDMTWRRRVEIAVDIAEGLTYLHEFPDGPVVHRDVKPTNVLLNDQGLAKLSDFGVSKILPPEMTHVSTAEIKGTRGYVDPECFAVGHVSEASDVYSFGIVLLELISGRRAVVPTTSGGAESIVYSAHEVMQSCSGGDEPDLGSMTDARLGMEVDRRSVLKVFEVAFKCVQPYKNQRPRMKEVLEVLKRVLEEIDPVGSTDTQSISLTDRSMSEDAAPSVDAWPL